MGMDEKRFVQSAEMWRSPERSNGGILQRVQFMDNSERSISK